jgi:O-acetyl-ADP-ribose deacetylase (regulator of RNase III)
MAAYAVQEAEKFMLKIINGNLLDSDCQYIAHQCNCHSLRGAGLASSIFKAFPWADVYSNRSDRGNDAPLFGSITVHGDPKRNQRYVINIYGQLKPLSRVSRRRASSLPFVGSEDDLLCREQLSIDLAFGTTQPD